MFAGTALSVRLFVYAGLSLFIISGPYLYMVVCVLYAYNLTLLQLFSLSAILLEIFCYSNVLEHCSKVFSVQCPIKYFANRNYF